MTASFAVATFENVWNQAKENKNHIAPCPSVQRGGRQRAQAMVCTFCLPKGCNPRIPAYLLTVGGGNLENRIRPYGTAPCGQPCRKNKQFGGIYKCKQTEIPPDAVCLSAPQR